MTELLTCGNGFPLVANERETSESFQEGRVVRAELNAINCFTIASLLTIYVVRGGGGAEFIAFMFSVL